MDLAALRTKPGEPDLAEPAGAAATPNASSLAILRVLPGWAYGLRHPTLLARGAIPPRHFALPAIDAAVCACLSGDATAGIAADLPFAAAVLARLLRWATLVQQQAGLPIYERPRLIGWGNGVFSVAAPYTAGQPQTAVDSLRWAYDATTGRMSDADDVTQRAAQLRARLIVAAPKSSNMPRFLRAAHDRGIPVDWVAHGTYQIGWGRHARWLDSSFTDATSALGTALARDKEAAARLLRRTGLPAPRHQAAATPEQAVVIAASLGYPVVVKPADRDGGIGVSAGLRTPQAVRGAFARAAAHSRRVLVEKHAPGRDYRLSVVQGALVWAVLRIPGGIIGDGRRTVGELLQALNAEKRRNGPQPVLKPLDFDAEAAALLAEAGLSLLCVPAADRFVALRSAANISTGGTAQAVFDRVHPDNRRLAQDAAAAFRLDIAGIDLLIEDIARSWHETGAVICEINAQPQFGYSTQQHLYGEVLGQLAPRQGRLPIMALLGVGAADLAETLRCVLASSGAGIGIAAEHSATLDGITIVPAAATLFAATQALLSRAAVELVLLVAETPSLLATGLPADRIDHLVLASDQLTGGAPHLMGAVLRMIVPHVSGQVLAVRDTPAHALVGAAAAPRRVRAVPPETPLAAAAIRALTGRAMAPAF